MRKALANVTVETFRQTPHTEERHKQDKHMSKVRTAYWTLSTLLYLFSLLAPLFSQLRNASYNKKKWKVKKKRKKKKKQEKKHKKATSSFSYWICFLTFSAWRVALSRSLCHTLLDYAWIHFWCLPTRLMLERKPTVHTNISSFVLMGYTKQFISQRAASLQNRSRWVISNHFRNKTWKVHSMPTTALLHALMTGSILHIYSPTTFLH